MAHGRAQQGFCSPWDGFAGSRKGLMPPRILTDCYYLDPLPRAQSHSFLSQLSNAICPGRSEALIYSLNGKNFLPGISDEGTI